MKIIAASILLVALAACGSSTAPSSTTTVNRTINLSHPSSDSAEAVRASVADICKSATTISKISGPTPTSEPGKSVSVFECQS